MCVQEGKVFVSPQMVSANTHFTLCIGPMKAHSAGFTLSCCSRTQCEPIYFSILLRSNW